MLQSFENQLSAHENSQFEFWGIVQGSRKTKAWSLFSSKYSSLNLKILNWLEGIWMFVDCLAIYCTQDLNFLFFSFLQFGGFSSEFYAKSDKKTALWGFFVWKRPSSAKGNDSWGSEGNDCFRSRALRCTTITKIRKLWGNATLHRLQTHVQSSITIKRCGSSSCMAEQQFSSLLWPLLVTLINAPWKVDLLSVHMMGPHSSDLRL